MLTFRNDFRVSNPKLHDLYVKYAMDQLAVIDEFVDRMNAFSQVTALMVVGAAVQEVNQRILEDAAWAEAVIRRRIGLPSPEELPQPSDEALDVQDVAKEATLR